MLDDTAVTFIGGGTMGEAMIKGLLSRELIEPSRITASEPRPARREYLASQYGIHVTDDNVSAAAQADVVVLAVKPQVYKKVAAVLRGKVPPDALVLSIIAGTRVASLEEGLIHSAIARAMPNMPAQIGQGITVWTTTPDVSDVQRKQAQTILGALGDEIWVEDEVYLDMATALSGTGPAYVFLFMEAMIDAGVHMGFPAT